ncbi:MAG: hypothetical protein M1835_004322 [Candelina submexicana]|nr:MAG: hypothetical protein M1835_004322 [Candelina submexicana]
MSASTFNPSLPASVIPHRHAAHNASKSITIPAAPAGTFTPGTKVQVGGHRVVIEKYLSEGGFAHVYAVRLPKPINGDDAAVLKRVAVPDKETLANMRTEVETMKKLKGHKHIVTYMDSHASQLKGGGYEVFLLMEYCAGGGLIDFMNTRLQNRLTEPEILKIFSDVAEGVACMHYLKPPLLHRDLKVENILISSTASSRRYKLCDFGSSAPPRPAAKTAAEGRLIEDDVQKHTTLQYRSPEMIDVYRKQPIDEKSDIWALGVLLYKLCYYITPFEEQGQMAILNASFKFPNYPAFSDRIKKLIASMLRESPQLRPNIYQVIREVCLMRGTDIPIKDIYAGRSHSEARRNEQLPSPKTNVASPPVVGAFRVPPTQEALAIPDIAPMRRGRPTKSSQQRPPTKPSPSPSKHASSDPFAALDSASTPTGDGTITTDELSSRFPTLDQFSLLHSSGSKFEFDQSSPVATTASRDITQRVTEVLADEAFAQPVSTNRGPSIDVKPSSPVGRTPSLSKHSSMNRKPEPAQQSSLIHQPTPQRPAMVSTGTMTSPSPPPSGIKGAYKSSSTIHRSLAAPEHRPSSQPRNSKSDSLAASGSSVYLRPGPTQSRRPALLDMQRSKSHTYTLRSPRSPASSRPSLEGQRPSSLEYDNPLNRSKSTSTRPRPSSAYVESNIEFLRDRESSNQQLKSGSVLSKGPHIVNKLPAAATGSSDSSEDVNITSNVDFLRSMEEDDLAKQKHRRSTSGTKHVKRSSMPSISLSGTKTLLAGRFGDAFRRFETNASGPGRPRSPSSERQNLATIAGSEATDGRSDDGTAMEETEEVPPEVRRELERRRLSQEERRVANATAEYRKQMADRDGPGAQALGARVDGNDSSRATSIQNKVKSLLNDENIISSPSGTSGSHGPITEPQRDAQARKFDSQPHATSGKFESSKRTAHASDLQVTNRVETPSQISYPRTRQTPAAPAPAPPIQRMAQRPSAPPKPKALRTGGQAEVPRQPSPTKPSFLAGRPVQPGLNPASPNSDDWEATFSKRYPSLSGLEMVETEIAKSPPSVPGGMRVKDI